MILNQTRNCVISENEVWATGLGTRFRGLIGHDFSGFDGMFFPRCSAIHTFFMGMKIDVLFIDKNGTVLGVYPEVRPWKPSLIEPGAWGTIELPAGTIARTETVKGDILRLENAENGAILPENRRK